MKYWFITYRWNLPWSKEWAFHEILYEGAHPLVYLIELNAKSPTRGHHLCNFGEMTKTEFDTFKADI